VGNSPTPLTAIPRSVALSDKQSAFVREYLVDLNATRAAIRAGYSEATAKQQGSRLLTNADVQAAVQEALESRADRTGITQDRIVAELAAIAFADLTDFATWSEDSVSLIESADLDPDKVKALKEIVATTTTFETENGTSQTIRMNVKQHDKLKALELLGRHLGMFKRDVDVNVQVGITIGRLHELASSAEAGDDGAGE
jgi:phage terminase small subunit